MRIEKVPVWNPPVGVVQERRKRRKEERESRWGRRVRQQGQGEGGDKDDDADDDEKAEEEKGGEGDAKEKKDERVMRVGMVKKLDRHQGRDVGQVVMGGKMGMDYHYHQQHRHHANHQGDGRDGAGTTTREHPTHPSDFTFKSRLEKTFKSLIDVIHPSHNHGTNHNHQYHHYQHNHDNNSCNTITRTGTSLSLPLSGSYPGRTGSAAAGLPYSGTAATTTTNSSGTISAPPPLSRRDLLDPDELAAASTRAILIGDKQVTFQNLLLNDLSPPFDWASFAQVASKKFLVDESVRFVEDYRAYVVLRCARRGIRGEGRRGEEGVVTVSFYGGTEGLVPKAASAAAAASSGGREDEDDDDDDEDDEDKATPDRTGKNNIYGSGRANQIVMISDAWHDKYLKPGALFELNVPDSLRKHVENKRPRFDPTLSPNTQLASLTLAWDPIYRHILHMLQSDIFPKWANMTSVKRSVALSRKVACWWRDEELTSVGKFFSFPNPIDKAEARCHGLCTVVLTTATLLLDASFSHWYLYPVLFAGFLLRTLCGPRLDPQAFLVLFLLRPLALKLGLLEHEFVPGPPRRFAQAVGFVVSGVALGVRVAAEVMMAEAGLGVGEGMEEGAGPAQVARYVAWVLLGMLLFFSSLLAFCDICVACYIFGFLMHLNLLPKSACESCTIHYVAGKASAGTGAGTNATKAGAGTGAGAKSATAPVSGTGTGKTVPHHPRQQQQPQYHHHHHRYPHPPRNHPHRTPYNLTTTPNTASYQPHQHP